MEIKATLVKFITIFYKYTNFMDHKMSEIICNASFCTLVILQEPRTVFLRKDANMGQFP
jgi:hypothetical protein